ncbi:MAG: alpha/beta-type small acid-soluble spore protein [Eubacteriaceae bacterium]|jgi:hypothetical protein|nr:alpha/beta-type small acid-soluble spore protein [Eubacteriaceae bacterium]
MAQKKKSSGQMDDFKKQVALELGINLKNGYNGNLTSKEAGYIGGAMVKKMIKAQKDMIEAGGDSTKLS